MYKLLAATALASTILPISVQASCVPDAPGDGAFVTCSGADADGFDFSDLDDIFLEVEPGAVVSNTGDALRAGDNFTVTNEGAIQSTGDDGVQAKDGLTLDNTVGSVISAADKGVDTEGFDDLFLINAGTITAGDKGVRAGADDDGNGGGFAFIDNSGAIRATDKGIETGDDAWIINSGLVSSTQDDAIQVGADALIENTSLITSEGGDAIDIDSGIIDNSGTIETFASGEAGIDIDEGSVGTISVTNSGTISGSFGLLSDPGNTRDLFYVSDGGTLSGFDGMAMDLGDGFASVSLLGGDTISGASDFGGGDDILSLFGTSYDFATAGLFDGGDDFDTLELVAFDITEMTELLFDGMVFDATFDTGADALSFSFTNWENIIVGGTQLSAADLQALSTTAVPLPAGLALLGTALAGFGVMRRRKR